MLYAESISVSLNESCNESTPYNKLKIWSPLLPGPFAGLIKLIESLPVFIEALSIVITMPGFISALIFSESFSLCRMTLMVEIISSLGLKRTFTCSPCSSLINIFTLPLLLSFPFHTTPSNFSFATCNCITASRKVISDFIVSDFFSRA